MKKRRAAHNDARDEVSTQNLKVTAAMASRTAIQDSGQQEAGQLNWLRYLKRDRNFRSTYG